MPIILDPTVSTIIGQVGPVIFGSDMFAPASFSKQGGPDSLGGIPVSINLVLQSLSEAELLHELINNPLRRQTLDRERGVLEWLETYDNLSTWRGWYLLTDCSFQVEQEQLLYSKTDNYVSVGISGVFYGPHWTPVVLASGIDKPDGFALTSVPTLVPLYPGTNFALPAQDFTTRRGFKTSGVIYTVDNTSPIISKIPLRINWNDLTFIANRPHIIGADGVLHFGPASVGIGGGIGASSFQVLLNADGTLKARTAAADGTIIELGNISIYKSGGAIAPHYIVGTRLWDDAAEMDIMDGDGLIHSVRIRVGDYGVRILMPSTQSWIIDVEGTYADNVANYYLETTSPLGGKRFIALMNVASSEASFASGQLTLGSNAEVFFGFEPTGSAGANAVAEQSKQFLYDRYEILTIE